ncbi:MAG: HAD family hydrolase [Candidatus Moranbacteria bacterium]|nr:HAD family hydrolase [Candidatus Moranbacteria bacterium]
MGKTKRIFFDCYQTLLDTDIDPTRRDANARNGWETFVSSLSERHDVRISADRFEESVERGKEAFYSAHDKMTRHHDLVGIVAEALRKECGAEIPDEEIRRFLYEYRKVSRGFVRPYPGVLETLERLSKRHLLSVASYTQSAFTLPELKEVGLSGFFSDHIFSSDIGFRKTSPDFYRECLRIIGAEPAECVMIGDNYQEDVAVPEGIGMKTIWIWNPVTAPEGLVPDRADAVVDLADIRRLSEVLDRMFPVSG